MSLFNEQIEFYNNIIDILKLEEHDQSNTIKKYQDMIDDLKDKKYLKLNGRIYVQDEYLIDEDIVKLVNLYNDQSEPIRSDELLSELERQISILIKSSKLKKDEWEYTEKVVDSKPSKLVVRNGFERFMSKMGEFEDEEEFEIKPFWRV